MDVQEMFETSKVVESYNMTKAYFSIVRDIAFDTKTYPGSKISMQHIKQDVVTITLGDGKQSIPIKKAKFKTPYMFPGYFDMMTTIKSTEIAGFNASQKAKYMQFLNLIMDTVKKHLGQLLDTMAARSLNGTYTHTNTDGGEMEFAFGETPVLKSTAYTKLTATSTIFDVSAQADAMRRGLIVKTAHKSETVILCGKDYYKMIAKIAHAAADSPFVKETDKPGVIIDGYLFLNDAGGYIDEKGIEQFSIGANDCQMINISQKSNIYLCDLEIPPKFKDCEIVEIDGIPLVISYEVKKGGFLIDLYFMAAPIAVPRLSNMIKVKAAV